MVDILFGQLGAKPVAASLRVGRQNFWLAPIINTALIHGLRQVKCWRDWHSAECLPLGDCRFKGTITQ